MKQHPHCALAALCLASLLLAASGCHRTPPDTGPAFDIQALIGMRIDAVMAQLGTPAAQTATQRTWKKDGQTLVVSFRPKNKRVTSFALTPDEPVQIKEELKDQLLAPGHLSANDPRYTLEWIESSDRVFTYTGVKAMPQLASHKVTFRITGSLDLLQVEYAAGAAPQTLLTAPPWETTVTVPEDNTLTLFVEQAKTPGNAGSGHFNVKLQIVVDGKVASEVASEASAAQCSFEL